MNKKSEKGQSMVEFSFTIVPLFMIIMVILNLGLALFYNIVLENAAEEGAKVASRWNVDSIDPSCADAALNAILRAVPGNFLDVTVSDSCPSTGVRVDPETEIKILVKYDFKPIFYHSFLEMDLIWPLKSEAIIDHQ